MSDEELLKNKGIIEEFNTIGNILKLELNYNIKNDLLGDIVYPSGSIGDIEKEKGGFGINKDERKAINEEIKMYLKSVNDNENYALINSSVRLQVGAIISYIDSIENNNQKGNKTNIKNEEKGENNMGEYNNEYFDKFGKLPQYNYDLAVLEDVEDFLDNELELFKSDMYSDFLCKMSEHYDSEKYDDEQFELKEAIIEYLEENVYKENKINGSYWFSRYNAQSCLFGNKSEVEKAKEYFGYENIDRPYDPETLDLLIRMSKVSDKINQLIDKDDEYLKLTIDAVKKYLSLEKDKGVER